MREEYLAALSHEGLQIKFEKKNKECFISFVVQFVFVKHV